MKRQVVIVTGDRDFLDVNAVARRLSRYPNDSILIHGYCDGADMIADELARLNGWTVLPIPFFKPSELEPQEDNRNALIVALGAAFVKTEQRKQFYEVTVEAFPPTVSRASGTRNCMRLAKEAGLLVYDKERQ